MNYNGPVWFWQVTLPLMVTILAGVAVFSRAGSRFEARINALLDRIDSQNAKGTRRQLDAEDQEKPL